MLLAKAPLSKFVRITRVRHAGPTSFRLMEMGLIEGAEVQVVGRAPLGDPIQVRLGDYDLSIRRTDAEMVDVA